jgi:hypothetical protein
VLPSRISPRTKTARDDEIAIWLKIAFRTVRGSRLGLLGNVYSVSRLPPARHALVTLAFIP